MIDEDDDFEWLCIWLGSWDDDCIQWTAEQIGKNKRRVEATSHLLIEHVRDLEQRALGGCEQSIKTLAVMVLLKEHLWEPDDGDGEPVPIEDNVVELFAKAKAA